MGKLIYLLNVSLDGYVETPDHSLDWAVVDDELHSWFNDRERKLDASLYGRGMYETMSAHWPTAEADPSSSDTEREYARIWMAQPRIVFSKTPRLVVGWNSRLARGDIETELARVRDEYPGDIGVGGATLAASFIRRGLVDEYQLMIHPVVLGAGTPFFPDLDQPIRLRPIDERTFKSGVRFMAYARE